MHGNYVNRNIFQDTEIYYFDANTYDEDFFAVECCVHRAYTLQYHEYIILPSELVQISYCDVQHK